MPHDTAAIEPVSGRRSSFLSSISRLQRELERDVAAGDRRGARAAVGLEHVAVDPDGALAERLEVDDAAQRAADQPLDLDGAAVRAPLRDVALLALAGGRGQHPVLGGHPAAALSGHPLRHRLLHRRRADHARAAHRDQRRPGGRAHEAGLDRERPQLVGLAARRCSLAHAAAAFAARRHVHVPDLAHRELEEARADGAERLGVGGAEEAVLAPAVLVALQAALAQRDLDLVGDRLARADDLDPAAEAALEHRPDERVVRAAEDDRVDVRVPKRIAVRLHLSDDAIVDLAARLDQRRELGARDRMEVSVPAGLGERLLVRAARDGGLGGEQAHLAVARSPRREPRLRPDHGDDPHLGRPARAGASGSAAAVAELHATTSSFAPSASRIRASSSANASSSSRERGPYGKRAVSPR